jgi:hypothetical protein
VAKAVIVAWSGLLLTVLQSKPIAQLLLCEDGRGRPSFQCEVKPLPPGFRFLKTITADGVMRCLKAAEISASNSRSSVGKRSGSGSPEFPLRFR